MKYKVLEYIFFAIIIGFFLVNFKEESTVTFRNKTIDMLVPQGFAFFTRNPREPQIYIYKYIKQDSLVIVNKKSSLSLSQRFGLSRTNRRVNIEFNNVLNKILIWHKDYDLAKKDIVSININDEESKIIQGKYLFVKEERIPWAWAKNDKLKPKRRYKILMINDDN